VPQAVQFAPRLRRAAFEMPRGIPVEVGLGGLLTVPEGYRRGATLRVLNDAPPPNALVRLLTGPAGGSARGPVALAAAPDRSPDRTAWPCHPASRRGRAREALTDLTTEPAACRALDDLGSRRLLRAGTPFRALAASSALCAASSAARSRT